MLQRSTQSISARLLRRVLSVYLLITLLVFLGQMAVEFRLEQTKVREGFALAERTFVSALTRAVWNLDAEQLQVTADGMVEWPHIGRVEILDESRQVLARADSRHYRLGTGYLDEPLTVQFELLHLLDDRTVKLGTAEIVTSRRAVLEGLTPTIIVTLIGSVFKTAVLVLLVTLAFRSYLTQPLRNLAQQAAALDPESRELKAVNVSHVPGDEIDTLQTAINGLLDKVQRSMSALDGFNRELEQQVADRTSSLRATLGILENERAALRQEVSVRQQKESALELAKSELEGSLVKLRDAQRQLIETEKMASLGGLVAGVAHEINTPVGLGLTGISQVQHLLKNIETRFEAGELEESHFKRFVEDTHLLARSIHVSLTRTAELVRSFKAVAVNHTHEQERVFDFSAYLNEVLVTHQSVLRKIPVQVQIDAPASLPLRSDPGIWTQILSNLLVNAVRYAFEPGQANAQIHITVQTDNTELVLVFADNGAGMPPEVRERIFEPFFTTGREKGGTGLGMHILYNIVTHKLQGRIQVHSEPGQGSRFTIVVPLLPLQSPPPSPPPSPLSSEVVPSEPVGTEDHRTASHSQPKATSTGQ